MLLVPAAKLSGARVLRVNEHLTVLVTTVETLSIVVADARSSKGKHLAIGVAFCACICSPKTYLDRQIALICNTNITTILYRPALLNIDLGENADLGDNTNCINCTHLLEVVDFLNRCETKASVLDGCIVVNLFYFRLLIKDNGVVVLDAGVFLISHFDLAVGKEVDSVL